MSCGTRLMTMSHFPSDHVPPIDHQLFDARHSPVCRAGRGMFDQHGDCASPASVPAAQQGPIALTGEILTQYHTADAAPLQREALYYASAARCKWRGLRKYHSR